MLITFVINLQPLVSKTDGKLQRDNLVQLWVDFQTILLHDTKQVLQFLWNLGSTIWAMSKKGVYTRILNLSGFFTTQFSRLELKACVKIIKACFSGRPEELGQSFVTQLHGIIP